MNVCKNIVFNKCSVAAVTLQCFASDLSVRGGSAMSF